MNTKFYGNNQWEITPKKNANESYGSYSQHIISLCSISVSSSSGETLMVSCYGADAK